MTKSYDMFWKPKGKLYRGKYKKLTQREVFLFIRNQLEIGESMTFTRLK